jgi:hypothetical protein
MPKLSKESRDRLDKVVLQTAARLHADPMPLRRPYLIRPSKFAEEVCVYINNNWDLRDQLWPEDLRDHSVPDRIKIIDATLRRLYRRGELRKEKLTVITISDRKSSGKKRAFDKRLLLCYWPTGVLDRLASI